METTPGSGQGRREPEAEPARKTCRVVQGYSEGSASSSTAGSHGHIITHSRFAELEEAKRAE
eukprot:4562600-Heterocapsa_arctica.AAC.1